MRSAVVLPAPLGPITARNSAALTSNAHAIRGSDPAEADMQVVDAGERGHAAARRLTRPASPPGLKRITSISIAPKISSR